MTDEQKPAAEPAKKEPTARQLKARADWKAFGEWKKAQSSGSGPAPSSAPAPVPDRAAPPPRPKSSAPASGEPAPPASPDVPTAKPPTEWFDHLNLGFVRDLTKSGGFFLGKKKE